MVKVLPMGMGYHNIDGRQCGFGSGIFAKLKFGVKYNDGTAWEYLKSGVNMQGITEWGQIGKSCGFGFIRGGATRFGDDNFFSGVYQKRVTGYNHMGRLPNRPRRSYYVRMRTYKPSNPQTEKQKAYRAIFAEAVAGWEKLTSSQKVIYSKRANGLNRTARSQFISEFLKIHYPTIK